jgi:hypothetical protein
MSTPSFAGVTPDEAVRRARDGCRACASAPRGGSRASFPRTLRDLHAAALRTLQPRRWGGMEFDFIAYVDFPLEPPAAVPHGVNL